MITQTPAEVTRPAETDEYSLYKDGEHRPGLDRGSKRAKSASSKTRSPEPKAKKSLIRLRVMSRRLRYKQQVPNILLIIILYIYKNNDIYIGYMYIKKTRIKNTPTIEIVER